MAYQISYGYEKPYDLPGAIRPGRAMLLSILFGMLFLTIAYRLWPEGAMVMDRLLSPDGLADAKSALETIALELRSGTSLQDAVAAFCREVISRSLSFAA